MPPTNPFTERGRITDPARFAGRWGELGMIFERIEAGRPVLISGVPGVGKSSLLTHITQSAAVNLETPELRAYYLDIAAAESAAQIYETLARSVGQRGDTLAALELGLVALDAPVLVCLDNADAALAAGWGEGLLEALARVVRGGHFALVVAISGAPPALSERYAQLRLGALAATEVRLLLETYLDGTGVEFTPQDLRAVAELSGGHPAYTQRAAYYLFASKLDPSLDWQVAYRVEARDRPIAGAPLPSAVFAGAATSLGQSSYTEGAPAGAPAGPQLRALPERPPLAIFLAASLTTLLAYLAAGSWLIAIAAGLAALLAVVFWTRSRRGV